jgi:hypothetical protein
MGHWNLPELAIVIASAAMLANSLMTTRAMRQFNATLTLVNQKYGEVILLLRDDFRVGNGAADNVGVGFLHIDKMPADNPVISDDEESASPE